MKLHWLTFSIIGSIMACYVGSSSDNSNTGASGGADGASGSGGSAPTGGDASRDGAPLPADGAASGTFCPVLPLLEKHCTSCHATPSAPMPLASYADLVAPARSNAAKRVVDLCVDRMTNASAPMPPTGLLPTEDVAILRAWIAAGVPNDCAPADGGAGAGQASSLRTPMATP